MQEMEIMHVSGKDCWLGRVEKIRQLLKIPPFQGHETPNAIGKQCKSKHQSKLESFYLSDINKQKLGPGG